ncbi:MAG: TetR/AcrR family transcriptional regulator [Armatimonadetes bacterium]|nr:TetR/AcrR family transcriptional regulator [Armatimonadota bacterium]
MSTSDERKYHHGDLPGQLIEAGVEAIERLGVDRLSLRELARQIGVSPNAPYRHFESKDLYLVALATEGFDRLTAVSEGVEDLQTLGRAFIGFALKHPNLFALMFSPVVSKSQNPELMEAGMRSYAPLLKLLGVENHSDPRAVKAWALVFGLATLRNNGFLVEGDDCGPDLLSMPLTFD